MGASGWVDWLTGQLGKMGGLFTALLLVVVGAHLVVPVLHLAFGVLQAIFSSSSSFELEGNCMQDAALVIGRSRERIQTNKHQSVTNSL